MYRFSGSQNIIASDNNNQLKKQLDLPIPFSSFLSLTNIDIIYAIKIATLFILIVINHA